MITEKLINKIQSKIPKDFLVDLQDIVVYQEQDGSYNLYSVYQITKEDGYFKVTAPSVQHPLIFNSLKNSVTWCSFDKRCKIHVSKRIHELDQRLAGIETDIIIHQTLVSKAKKIDDKLVYLAKLGEEKIKRKQMKEELQGYVVESVNWQNKRFNRKPT